MEAIKVDGYAANTRPFTPDADALFDSDYTTAQLAYELAQSISPFTDHMIRVRFERELADPTGPWVRGSICKELIAFGTTLSVINRRRS